MIGKIFTEKEVILLMFTALRPLVAMLTTAAIGYLVAQGDISPHDASSVSTQVDTFFGGLIVTLSAGAALYHLVIKHKPAAPGLPASASATTAVPVTDTVSAVSNPAPVVSYTIAGDGSQVPVQ